MLSPAAAAWLTIVVCVIAAAVEGVCAGKNVRAFFQTLRFPKYAAPLWVWSIIGVVYYVIFGFLVFRLLTVVPSSPLAVATLTLLGVMMFGNGLTNVVIFRARDLRLSYFIGLAFAGLDVVVMACLLQLDPASATALTPYLVYRLYAVWWGHAVMKLNPVPSCGSPIGDKRRPSS